MAKYRNGGKKGGIKVTAILCAAIIAIAGVLVTLIGVGSSWFTNADVRTWFNSWGKAPETYEFAVLPQEAGCMVLSTTRAKGEPVALSGAYSNGQKTCTLTATLTPADAYYSSVTWTATDQDGNASTHVKLTQDENNPLTVQVELVGELFFTERITVEIVSVNTLTASCNVDYLAFPDSVSVSPDPYTQYLKCGATYSLDCDFNYETTAGTVTGVECKMTDWQIYLTNDTLAAISSELGVPTGSWDYSWDGTKTMTLKATPWDMFYGGDVSKDDFNRAFFKVCNGRNDIAELSVNCEFIYNGKTYAHLSGYRTIGIDSASYAIGLDGVSIDDIFIAG